MNALTLNTLRAAALAASIGAGAPAAWAAGQVDIQFVKPDDFADIGFGTIERERTLKQLAEALGKLAGRVPDGQTLHLEVLDVDLAGQAWPLNATNIRVLTGRADWPRMTLRYSLQRADGSVVGSGEAKLADLNYLQSMTGGILDGPLVYERRMVERWFDDTFGPRQRLVSKESK
jgi:hypothetical protein